MTTEEMKFWMDIFHSPVAIALASGLAGSLITLIVTLLKLRHDSNENKKSWERQEQRRIEERAFKEKTKAYKEFFKCFETTYGPEPSNFDRFFAPCLIKLMVYGTLAIKQYARLALIQFVESKKYQIGTSEYNKCMDNAKEYCNEVHTAMMEDIDTHFYRDDMNKWKEQLAKLN